MHAWLELLEGRYLPCAQSPQDPPFGPLYPALQMHRLRLLLPGYQEKEGAGQKVHADIDVAAIALEYVPLSHTAHALEPLTLLYLPAIHETQSVPSGPVNPCLQTQEVMVLDAARETALLGQSLQSTRVRTAVTLLYLPAGQFEHGNIPTASLNLPAAHPMQLSVPSPVYPMLQEQFPRVLLPGDELM